MIIDLTKAQGQTWEKLSNISNSDKIGSAYLFNGPIGCGKEGLSCLLYTSPSPRDATLSRMPSSA